MSSRLPTAPIDAPEDDWLGGEEVDWGDDPRTAGTPRRAEGAVAPTVRTEAGGDRVASAEAPGDDVIRRRRAIALIALVALVLAGVAVGVILVGGDDPPAPTTSPLTVTQPPAATEPPTTTEPPSTATQPPAAAEPPTAVTLPAEGALARGASGEEVEALQSALASLELYTGDVDGDFGAGTEEAVVAFQEANDLPADGIVGQGTADKINELLAAEGATG